MAQTLTADLSILQSTPIELEYLDGDLNIIQKLDDEPNDVGGLSSAQLKAKFDEAGNTIKEYINETLIPAILAADATEEARTEAEAQRAANETARVSAESARQAAETQRASAEAARCVWEDYDAETAYAAGSKVYYLGSSYVCRAACTGVLPTDTEHWGMVAASGDTCPNAVRYDTAQALTAAQKTQARENIGAGAPVTVDAALSGTSENPVQNKAVKAALDSKQEASSAITTGNIASQTVNKAAYATDAPATTAPGLRNQYFAAEDTTPTVNGQVCWTYG